MIKYHKIEPNHIIDIYEYVRSSEASGMCRADLSLPYLLTYWRLENTPSYAWLNGNLVLELYDIEYASEQTVLVGNNLIQDTIDLIFDDQISKGVKPEISMATSEIIRSIKMPNPRISIEHNRDLDEYILDSKIVANFSSPKLRTFKQAVSAFNRSYGSKVKIEFNDMTNRSIINELVNSLHSWESKRTTNNDPKGIEKKYNDALLSAPSEAGINSVIIRLNEKLVGFCLFSLVSDKEFCLPHIIKVDYSYDHIFDYVLHVLCSKMNSIGISYINAEEDLGILGIRHKKEHLAPIMMDARFTISLLGGEE